MSSAGAAAERQADNGSLPAGHNGPYRDPETPVRNTGHWLITFLKAYEITGDERFKGAARRAASYLCGVEARPDGYTFLHRNSPRKDSCNGLIGQAWTIEALATAAPALEMPELAAVAEDVFVLHPFDEDLGLWKRVEVDGSVIGFDSTFNHQLWFAAAGSLLAQPDGGLVSRRVERFVEALPQNMSLYESGLVRHPLQRRLPGSGRRDPRGLIAGLLRRRNSGRPDQSAMSYKALGYHAFNLYAIALLATRYPRRPVWRSVMLRTALLFIDSEEYLSAIEENRYGFPYNPPGFENAFALHTFEAKFQRDVRAEMGEWVARQLRRCYDFDSHQMSRGTEDPATHAARLYEATRLPDLELALDESGLAPTQPS